MAVCIEKEFEVASQVLQVVDRIYIAQVRLATVLLSINGQPAPPPKVQVN